MANSSGTCLLEAAFKRLLITDCTPAYDGKVPVSDGTPRLGTILLSEIGDRSFGISRVMGAIISLGCNWWKNMHQIDA